jgi:hypothetical protein
MEAEYSSGTVEKSRDPAWCKTSEDHHLKNETCHKFLTSASSICEMMFFFLSLMHVLHRLKKIL